MISKARLILWIRIYGLSQMMGVYKSHSLQQERRATVSGINAAPRWVPAGHRSAGIRHAHSAPSSWNGIDGKGEHERGEEEREGLGECRTPDVFHSIYPSKIQSKITPTLSPQQPPVSYRYLRISCGLLRGRKNRRLLNLLGWRLHSLLWPLLIFILSLL